eukprot:jgi/Psemu1/5170/gm1.5170_g
MSMKLVRKFLQQDDNNNNNNNNNNTPAAGEASAAAKRRTKRRRAAAESASASTAVVTEEELIKATIQGMVYLDEAMATHTGKSESQARAAKRLHKQAKDVAKRRRASKHAIVGNSRSSASQLQKLPLQPTFDKKRHKKELEAKRLKEIARLLNKRKIKKK